ncbi:MAG: hypothetical protein HOQ13_13505 [Dermatophilaceae bacterium]|nr:hypothetical protein [Dermatophilaceae bacterium]
MGYYTDSVDAGVKAAQDAARAAQAAAETAAGNVTGAIRDASLARNPDALIAGTVTRDSNGAATSAPVVWPDGTPGTYTALVVSTAFPGAVDSYSITYGSPAIKTYTQPTITRNADGAATTVPAITVS